MNVNTTVNKSPTTRRLFKRVALKTVMVCLAFLVATEYIFEDTQLRRILYCRNRRGMKKLRYLQTDSTTEDGCEIVYPAEVEAEVVAAAETEALAAGETIDYGTLGDVYYAPPDPDAGLYYPPEVLTDDLEEPIENITNPEGEVSDPAVLVPDVEEPVYYSPVDNTLLEQYEPQVYEPVVPIVNETTGEVYYPESTAPENTTAYAVTITSCPEVYYEAPASEITDPGADIYEASAIIKSEVCDATGTTTGTARERGLQETNIFEDYTMYAIVHPEAVNCPNADGTTYNRVKLLQDQGYYVEILGQPLTNVSLLLLLWYLGICNILSFSRSL